MEKPALTLAGLDAVELPALEETYAELQLEEEVFPLAEGSTEDSSNSNSTTSKTSSNSNNDSNNNHNKRTVTAHT